MTNLTEGSKIKDKEAPYTKYEVLEILDDGFIIESNITRTKISFDNWKDFFELDLD